MTLGRRRTEDVPLAARARRLATRLAALAIAASAPPSAAIVLQDVQATLTLDAVGFPPIAASALVEVELDPGVAAALVQSLSLAPHQFATQLQSVVATLGPPVALGASPDNEAGVFHRSEGGSIGGVMPMGGALRVCLFGDCEGAPTIAFAPLSVVGQGGAAFASDAGLLVTIVGGPWTTGTVSVGAETAHGSHAEQRIATDVASRSVWFHTSLVTPVFISTNQASYAISAVGRLELLRSTPACDDGQDGDGDGAVDFPDDAGCTGPEDLWEQLDFRDGALHVLDVILAAGESVRVSGSFPETTILRIVDGAAVGGDLRVEAGGLLDMTGGTIDGPLQVIDGSATVAGGSVGYLWVWGEGSLLVRGTQFDRPFGPVDETSGSLSGTLADGTPLAAAFQRDDSAQLVLPEPDARLTALAVAVGLAALRRGSDRRG